MTMSNTPKNLENTQPTVVKTPAPRRPNETGTISLQAHMRIFDPITNKTIVETRG
jgi:hypothetical protein